MRTLRALLPFGVALVLALAIFATPAAAQPANLPTWQVGQEAAYGVHVPVGQELAPLVAEIEANPSAYNITHINALNVTGNLDSWVDQQVTQATSTYYVLHTTSASGLSLHVAVNATFNNLPQAGSFPGSMSYGFCTPATPPVHAATLAVTLDLEALTTSDGTTNYAVSNLAIMNDTTNAAVRIKGSADLFNIPAVTTNSTTCVTTVAYKSENLGITVDTQNLVRTLYSPALDVFHFPISDGASWWANSSVTTAGTFTGTINVQGLSAQDQQAFFDNVTKAFASVPGLAVSGLSSFPIDLSQVSVIYGGVNIFDHGTLHDTPPYPVALHLAAKESNMSLADNQFHEVFYIYQNTGVSTACPTAALAAVYSPTYPSPGHGMIVGYSAITCFGGAIQPIFELAPTPPATAQKNIGNTETTYNPFPPQGNVLADFFTQSPYWGVILIVAVVVVVGALLVMRRRRKPAMAPPAAQPPASPPPPSGPGNP